MLDGLGALAWAGAWLGLGYVFRDALDSVTASASDMGGGALIAAGSALSVYAVVKFVRRRLFLLSHRLARITPQDLAQRLAAEDETVVVIDTRSALEVGLEPFAIAGALRIPAEEIARRHSDVPRDRDVVLYCT